MFQHCVQQLVQGLVPLEAAVRLLNAWIAIVEIGKLEFRKFFLAL
jgi:hypothetical protein